jgi:hypothetical protein
MTSQGKTAPGKKRDIVSITVIAMTLGWWVEDFAVGRLIKAYTVNFSLLKAHYEQCREDNKGISQRSLLPMFAGAGM